MDLKTQIINTMAEEIGLLGEIIFHEILDALGIREADLNRVWAGKFIKLLDQKLPRDIDDRELVLKDIARLLVTVR